MSQPAHPTGPRATPAPPKPPPVGDQPGVASAASAAAVGELAKRIIGNVEQAIVGKRKQLVLSLVTWLSRRAPVA